MYSPIILDYFHLPKMKKKKNVKSQKIKEKKEKYITYFSNHKSEIYCKINNSSKWCLNFRCFFHYIPLFYLFIFCSTYITFFFFCSAHIIIYTFYSLYFLYIVLRLYETDSRRYWWKILHFNKNQISYHISKAFLNYVSKKKKELWKKISIYCNKV